MIYSEQRMVEVFAHPLSLNKSMVNMFCMFVEDYLKAKRPLVNKEMRGTHSQFCNFSYLRHLGLIDFAGKNEGWWPTEKGLRFYRGEVALTLPVFHMNNELLPETHETYRPPYCKKRVTKFIHEIDETRYKQVQEWQAAMRNNPTLFPENP